jgi:RNA polymerase sigma factor (sigma-70 family)
VPPRRQPASNGPDPDATRSSLLRRLKNWDDHGGWQEFFDTYWKLIYAVAIKAGLSDAEAHDVVQETVVSVAKQMRADGYDRSKGTFKNWLFTITRRRIVDHLRRRKPEEVRRKHQGSPGTSSDTDTLDRIVDPASVELETIWSEEWKKNLVDVAIERVKAQISFKQFQIFDLYVLKDWPLRDVTRMLHVSATLVYVTKHRVNTLIKREVRRLEQEFGKTEHGPT